MQQDYRFANESNETRGETIWEDVDVKVNISYSTQ